MSGLGFVDDGGQAVEVSQCPHAPGTVAWRDWQHAFVAAQSRDPVRRAAAFARADARMAGLGMRPASSAVWLSSPKSFPFVRFRAWQRQRELYEQAAVALAGLDAAFKVAAWQLPIVVAAFAGDFVAEPAPVKRRRPGAPNRWKR